MRTLTRLLFLGAAFICAATIPGTAQPSRRVVEVTAERFEFWPPEIVVEPGEEIEIRVTSEDTIHGFRIVDGDVNLTVPKRGKGPVVAVFRAGDAGRHVFECSRMCGAGHHFMRGEIIVRPRGKGGR